MYRILFILVTVVVVALAVGYGLRSSHKTSNAVTSLLPRGTIAFVHVPDLARTREDWHHSDIYQLYSEPSVQDFLRKPLSRLPSAGSAFQAASDIEKIDPKDAFFAVTSEENDKPRMVAGFRFRGSPDDAEKVVSGWQSKLFGTPVNGGAARETVDYQRHTIQVYRIGSTAVCTVYAGHWFFVANNLDELEHVVDRADGRVPDSQALLGKDDNFHEAIGNMPADYALCFYFQPRTLAQKLAALRASAGRPPSPGQSSLIAQIRSICGTTRFDGGKMHDVFFIGMPEQTGNADLTRSSLALASTDTLLYLATLLDISKQFALVDPSPSSGFMGARLQRIGQGLATAGITAAEWQQVFGSEISALAEWRADSHWPGTLISFPVKDPARAKKIAGVLARVLDDDGAWVETDKNGVHYISSPYTTGFLTLRPTIGVSDRFMVAGLDMASVESAFDRSVGNSSDDLAASAAYKRAAHMLPDPTKMFTYVDLGLLYTRLDASLRPMLLMGAAFMPAMSDYLDVGKLPPADIVAKHLTPIVSSQRYRDHGYVAESIGPLTLSQTGVGALLLAGAGVFGYQHSGLSALGALGLPSFTHPGMASPGQGGGRSGGPYRQPTPAISPVPIGTP
jgi:hypothetical protein